MAEKQTNTKKKTSTQKKPVQKKPAGSKSSTTTKKPPVKKKTTTKQVPKKTNKLQVTKEIVEKVETEFAKGSGKKGKTFYLIFSLVFYAAAFFYINNTLFNNNDYMQSALFAFAALFVVFVLLQFNIHLIFINFFRLPLKFMFDNAKVELNTRKDSKFSFGKYKSTFALTLYSLFLGLIIGSNIYRDVTDKTPILSSITQSVVIIVIFLVIVCSWQYLFNIIPNILEKSLDAKNGFILTLSAAVMVMFVLFRIFDINYLNNVMIFILLIGFIALLGVNLNMIVGEINIFQNLRNRHSKTVTRVVFLIFFSFHLYVIVYASVVAFSIYNADNTSYNFSNTIYEYYIVEDLENNNVAITELNNTSNMPVTDIYNDEQEVVTEFYDEDGIPLYPLMVPSQWGNMPNPDLLDEVGNSVEFTDQNFNFISEQSVTDSEGNSVSGLFYDDGEIKARMSKEVPYEYGTFLYYTVVTISTLGYGDISPNLNNSMAMVWGGFLSVYGFTFFALSIGFVSNIAIENVSRKDE